MTNQATRLRVVTKYADSESEASDSIIEVRKFDTTPATVTVQLGSTVNIGNYESVRIDVGITLPCYTEECDSAYEYAKKWAERRLLEEMEEAKKFAASR